jgi:integrase
VSAVRCWVLPELGERLIKDVRESDCEAVMLAMVAAGRSGAHRRLIHTAMASLFGTAVRERLITVSPMAHVARPSAGKSKAVAVSPEQIHALAANLHSSQMLVHVVPFMALTGTRRGEALGVRWEDVDEEAGVIHLRFQVNRDSSGLDLRSLKTDGSERDIALTPPLRELLRARRKVQMRDRLRSPIGSWTDNGLVFTTRRGTMVEPNNVNRAFRQYAERAGLPTVGKGKVTPHSLRHSVATLLLAAGVDEKVVAEVLGHSSPRITREVYQHVTAKETSTALGKVGEALGW